jgi:hypothetical protein
MEFLVAMQFMKVRPCRRFSIVVQRAGVVTCVCVAALRSLLRQRHDFFEGVRCMLVDKGSKPTWIPDHIDALSDGDVAEYFVGHDAVLGALGRDVPKTSGL